MYSMLLISPKQVRFFFLLSESCFLDRCCSPVSRLLDADRVLQYLLSLLHNHVYLPFSKFLAHDNDFPAF